MRTSSASGTAGSPSSPPHPIDQYALDESDDHYGCAPVRITAHRGDRHLDVMNVQASRLEDGKVAEFWDTTTDPDAMEAFFA